MIYTLIGIVSVMILVNIYKRYFPVQGLKNLHWTSQEFENIQLIDTRDYNISDSDPVDGAMNIPIAYLNRYYEQISDSKVLYVIASDSLEKNVGVRILRRRGFEVIGYSIRNHQKLVENDIHINAI